MSRTIVRSEERRWLLAARYTVGETRLRSGWATFHSCAGAAAASRDAFLDEAVGLDGTASTVMQQ